MSSILNLGRDKTEKEKKSQPRLPPAAYNVPPPAPQPGPAVSATYQRAHDFAQRVFETEAEIDKLKLESDQWRARAIAAEEQVKRLDENIARDRVTYDTHVQRITEAHLSEIAKLSNIRQVDVNRLTGERDKFKLLHARTVERLHVAGKIVLDALSIGGGEEKLAEPEVQNIIDEVEREMLTPASEGQRFDEPLLTPSQKQDKEPDHG